MKEPKHWVELVLSDQYRYALAEVMIQWAYFESEFDGLLSFVRCKPAAAALKSDIPYSFKQRLKLLQDSAQIAFSACPPLLERCNSLVTESWRLKIIRDHITHCRWAGNPADGHLSTYTGRGANREITVRETIDRTRSRAADLCQLALGKVFILKNGTGLIQ